MKKILFSLMMLCCMTAVVAQPSPGGGYTANSYEKLKTCIENAINNGNPTATITLTADIYLKDEGELCNTFKGTLDGNGYTIYAGDANAHHDDRGLAHGKYLFTYSEGATFKNLTFKDFRADTQQHSNWSFLTSQAKDGCVFENITFDHVSIFSNYSNVGAVAGIANGCTFTNITVKNGDFTVDDNQVGAVVGDASGCTFKNIEINSCESTADDDYAGGVVGKATRCTFEDINVKNSFIKINGRWCGGIAGFSDNSSYTRCVIDDKSCVCSDGASNLFTNEFGAYAGGITGESDTDEIHHCINSALIAADQSMAGGIVGHADKESRIEDCLNTGMVVSVKKSQVEAELYSKYKNATPSSCLKKTYKGIDYYVRRIDFSSTSNALYGGIVGYLLQSTVLRCASFGYMNKVQSVGGIVGDCDTGATVSDCLRDFDQGYNEVNGIVGLVTSFNVSVTNCINITAAADCSYSITASASFANLFSYHLGNITPEMLASGEICAKLGAAWEQNDGDPYPTPTVTVFYDNLENEARYNYHYYSTTGSVVIKRTFDNDGWYSLCLPFDVDATQTAEKFAQVAEFSELDGNTNTYKFTTVDHIEAGKPYIVRVDTKLENPKFSSVTIAANVEADNSGAFVGVLKPTEVKSGDLAIGSGTTVNPMHEGTMKAFRAYFPQTSANATKAMRFTVDDGEATSIQSLTEAEGYKLKAEGAYNLAGQKVDENYRGIVIKNGKKILKK